MPLVIAHRGASAHEEENSLAAFRRALQDGADGVELDVHDTTDGSIVVFHDPAVGGRRLSDMTLEAATSVRLSNGETMPTLAAALDTLGPDVYVFIEVKTLAPDHDGALFDVIDAAPNPERCHIHGFDHRIVKRLSAQKPSLGSGVLQSSYPIEPLRAVSDVGASSLWQHESLVDEALVHAAHDRGTQVIAWTVDDEHRMRTLAALGVDGICSNDPKLAREVFG